MFLKLNSPLVFFDLETTGTDFSKDRIVQISLLKLFPVNQEKVLLYLVNPGTHIPPESTAIHSITDKDVKNSPKFKDLAKELYVSDLIACSPK